MEHRDIRDAPGLLARTLGDLTSLIQGELWLARAEMKQNLTRAGGGIAFIAVAGVLALVGINVLASALVAYLAQAGLSVGLAAVVVGGALLAVAAILIVMGKSRLTVETLSPERTIRNLSRDLETLKEAGDV